MNEILPKITILKKSYQTEEKKKKQFKIKPNTITNYITSLILIIN